MRIFKTVLVVEDETRLRVNMAAGLRKLDGIEVIIASSVREAITMLDEQPLDLLISDIDLPDGLGVQLIGELTKRGCRCPILFVTGYRTAYGSLIPPHASVEVLEKPLSLQTLREAVQRRLGEAPVSSPFSVADYVQLACNGGHSVAIEVSGGTFGGEVEIVRGELWSAHDEEGEGVLALRRLAFRSDAKIVCSVIVAPRSERTIHDAWEGVLMDCARMEDETRSGRFATEFASEVTLPSFTLPDELDDGSDEFSRVYDEAILALMEKSYARAVDAFLRARALRPEDRMVHANLIRLRELGYFDGD